MSYYGLKIKKSETPDKTLYTVYYPHSIDVSMRSWTQDYYQIVSIDPNQKNYAIRIERRYKNGWITPLVFDKVTLNKSTIESDVTICDTYQHLTSILDKYVSYYDSCHFIIIKRQPPQDYRAVRISTHTISYFSIRLHNTPLLSSIIELDPKLKILGAPKGITEKQFKAWMVEKARELLTLRQDTFSIKILNYFPTKQDDLSRTVCQAEALFIYWGFPATSSPSQPLPPTLLPVTQQPTSLTLSLHPNLSSSTFSSTLVPTSSTLSLNISSVNSPPSSKENSRLNIVSPPPKQALKTLLNTAPSRNE